MATKFVARKTSRLFKASQGDGRRMVLIFGDDVETAGPAQDGRLPVKFRGRDGWIAADHLGDDPGLELYFIDVGQGDSTFIVTPGRKKVLIDGGVNRRALGFLAWKYRLDQNVPPVDIDLLVLTHADGDHINGLVPIIRHPKVRVRRIIHNGIATFAEGAFQTVLGDQLQSQGRTYLTTRHDAVQELDGLQLTDAFRDWRDAIEAEGCPYGAVDTTTGAIDVGDPSVRIEVLGPRLATVPGTAQKLLPWFDDPAHTINGNSVVLRLEHDHVSILLSGDLNTDGERHLLDGGSALTSKLTAHVLKAPHHGSHEFYTPFLEAVRPQVSVISSGDDPDHGHPRASLLGAIGHASRSNPLIFATEIAATFVEAGEAASPAGAAGPDAAARILFKRRLHGMINVRSDGRRLYAARRVNAGYWWESYGPIPAGPP